MKNEKNMEENELEVTTKRSKIKTKKGRTGRRFGRQRLESLPFNFRIPKTGFSCKGRAPGYYADMDEDCTVKKTSNQLSALKSRKCIRIVALCSLINTSHADQFCY